MGLEALVHPLQGGTASHRVPGDRAEAGGSLVAPVGRTLPGVDGTIDLAPEVPERRVGDGALGGTDPDVVGEAKRRDPQGEERHRVGHGEADRLPGRPRRIAELDGEAGHQIVRQAAHPVSVDPLGEEPLEQLAQIPLVVGTGEDPAGHAIGGLLENAAIVRQPELGEHAHRVGLPEDAGDHAGQGDPERGDLAEHTHERPQPDRARGLAGRLPLLRLGSLAGADPKPLTDLDQLLVTLLEVRLGSQGAQRLVERSQCAPHQARHGELHREPGTIGGRRHWHPSPLGSLDLHRP